MIGLEADRIGPSDTSPAGDPSALAKKAIAQNQTWLWGLGLFAGWVVYRAVKAARS